ncbi:hypothetical protein [Streptomyces sp. NPDC058861]|uniref:hypothetical protein n=1 Tax=Streptomyces sp. NPDC058861 TaxID=3346653 RepID=UPI0036891427
MPFWKKDDTRSTAQEPLATAPAVQPPVADQPAGPANPAPGTGAAVGQSGAEGVAKGLGIEVGKAVWRKLAGLCGIGKEE